MKTALLKSLRLDATNWWYQPTDPTERRRQHHRSFASHLETIRKAKLATIGIVADADHRVRSATCGR